MLIVIKTKIKVKVKVYIIEDYLLDFKTNIMRWSIDFSDIYFFHNWVELIVDKLRKRYTAREKSFFGEK